MCYIQWVNLPTFHQKLYNIDDRCYSRGPWRHVISLYLVLLTNSLAWGIPCPTHTCCGNIMTWHDMTAQGIHKCDVTYNGLSVSSLYITIYTLLMETHDCPTGNACIKSFSSLLSFRCIPHSQWTRNAGDPRWDCYLPRHTSLPRHGVRMKALVLLLANQQTQVGSFRPFLGSVSCTTLVSNYTRPNLWGKNMVRPWAVGRGPRTGHGPWVWSSLCGFWKVALLTEDLVAVAVADLVAVVQSWRERPIYFHFTTFYSSNKASLLSTV